MNEDDVANFEYSGRIGVLCGGDSPERPGSLVSGRASVEALRRRGFQAELLDVATVAPKSLGGRIDVAFLALHGLMGEDGKVQGVLDWLGIPYTGSGVLASSLCMWKPAFKSMVVSAGVETPDFRVLGSETSPEDSAREAVKALGLPVVMKPCSGGGSLGIQIAKTYDGLVEAIESASDVYDVFMAESYVPGRDVTVGVLNDTCLPPLECVSHREFFDYEAKHDPSARTYYCPARLSEGVIGELRRTALRVQRAVRAHGVTRVDFRVRPSSGLSVLELNTVPGMSELGNLATMAEAAGISYDDLVVEVLRTAFTKKTRYVP